MIFDQQNPCLGSDSIRADTCLRILFALLPNCMPRLTVREWKSCRGKKSKNDGQWCNKRWNSVNRYVFISYMDIYGMGEGGGGV